MHTQSLCSVDDENREILALLDSDLLELETNGNSNKILLLQLAEIIHDLIRNKS